MGATAPVGSRLVVGLQTLNLPTVVRIHSPQPEDQSVAHSSRGLGHRPLKAEIRGSNPLRPTKTRHKKPPKKTWEAFHFEF